MNLVRHVGGHVDLRSSISFARLSIVVQYAVLLVIPV